MFDETIETRAHTTQDGLLNLSVNVGVSDVDVYVTVHVRTFPSASGVDANGWPSGYFERMSGAIPELERAPQGDFEHRRSLE